MTSINFTYIIKVSTIKHFIEQMIHYFYKFDDVKMISWNSTNIPRLSEINKRALLSCKGGWSKTFSSLPVENKKQLNSYNDRGSIKIKYNFKSNFINVPKQVFVIYLSSKKRKLCLTITLTLRNLVSYWKQKWFEWVSAN